jgi:uncharacterized repeat protein (TIGR03803 family)
MHRLDGWKQMCAVFVVLIATVIALPAQTLTTLHNFNGTNGANPYVALVQGSDGNFYGTTIDGGANSGGNIFVISSTGAFKSLYDFCSLSNCADGEYPVTVLIEGADGSFYGTTQSGGASGWGTVFKLTKAGTLTTLHSFDLVDDGAAPYGSLVLAANGYFYGTTNGGGSANSGTVFKITPEGTLSTLYMFCSKSGCSDGQYPVGTLTQASDGNIYGTTHAGGSYGACDVDGCGTVFKITPDGALTTLHTFVVTDGEYPYGGVIEGPKGAFYGTTGGGGVNSGGTVFEMSPTGTLNTLYSFDFTDGSTPYAITLASDGNLYGTTESGGPDFGGTVFKITPGGTLTTLENFGGTAGRNLYAGLVQGTNGIFYGSTYFGGSDDNGIIFSLSTGLPAFVEAQPGAGRVGTTVKILGNNLTGTTSVTFNGVSADFTIVSPSLISATVPVGATSGKVDVSGSDQDLSTIVPFVVPQ